MKIKIMPKTVVKSDVYVYIAGKYTASSIFDVEQNILNAKKIAIDCANNNIKFFCPHTHTAHFEQYSSHVSWQYNMDLCMPILYKVCNVIIMVPGWEDSIGAKKEFDIVTTQLNYPWFVTFEKFFEWYKTLQD